MISGPNIVSASVLKPRKAVCAVRAVHHHQPILLEVQRCGLPANNYYRY